MSTNGCGREDPLPHPPVAESSCSESSFLTRRDGDLTLRPSSETPDIFKALPTSSSSCVEVQHDNMNNSFEPINVTARHPLSRRMMLSHQDFASTPLTDIPVVVLNHQDFADTIYYHENSSTSHTTFVNDCSSFSSQQRLPSGLPSRLPSVCPSTSSHFQLSHSSSTPFFAYKVPIAEEEHFDSSILTDDYVDTRKGIHKEDLDHEDTWSQFQGSVVSSFGRRYLKRREKEKIKRKRSHLRQSSFFSSWSSWSSLFWWSKVFPSKELLPSPQHRNHRGHQTSSSETEAIAPFHASPVFAETADTLHSYPFPLPSPLPVTAVTLTSNDEASSPLPKAQSQTTPKNKKLFPFSIPSYVTCITFFLLLIALLLLIVTSYFNGKEYWRGQLSQQPRRNRPFWWREAIFYEIFPASFRDSNNDGFGDLTGIREKIPYLKDLGVNTIRINSIFSALDFPHQYEHVLDFKGVDPKLGTLRDFDLLVRDLHSHGLNLVLDVNPCITSDQHPWATQWLSNKSSEFGYFYVPNRHHDQPLDMTSTTARDRESKELEDIHLSFGGHLYLNWSDAHVRNEMTDIFRFWMNRGVDGFFLKDVHFLQVAHPDDIYSSLFEILQVVDPSTSSLLSPLSKPSVHSDVKSSFFLSSQENQTRVLIASRSSLEAIVDRHALESTIERRQEADPSSLSRTFLDIDKINTSAWTSTTSSRLVLLPRDPFSYFHMIDTFLDLRMNESESVRDQLNEVFIKDTTFRPWILWNVGSSTSSRLSTRIGSDFVVTAAFLLFMMPGSISIFYGDEVGLRDSFDIASKRVYRGGQLMPMAWTSTMNGGFSSSNRTTTVWMPMKSLSSKTNVQNASEMIRRVQELTSFRRHNLTPSTPDNRGNYLFHYIHDGQIVMERYFSPISYHFSLSSLALSSPALSNPVIPDVSRRRKRESQETAKRTDNLSTLISEQRDVQESNDDIKSLILDKNTRRSRGTSRMTNGSPEEEGDASQSSASFNSIRRRFVLFANLSKTPRVKDLRDKFHLGSIRVTSNPKRIRDFLYFRSLKLDPGEAIIAQVE